jgi:DNA-binding GntR family transcriptional regulator
MTMASAEIEKTIRERIASGVYRPRRRIPSQAELADEFQVSGRTIAKIIARLRDDGMLWTLPHKGSYSRPKEHWRVRS